MAITVKLPLNKLILGDMLLGNFVTKPEILNDPELKIYIDTIPTGGKGHLVAACGEYVHQVTLMAEEITYLSQGNEAVLKLTNATNVLKKVYEVLDKLSKTINAAPQPAPPQSNPMLEVSSKDLLDGSMVTPVTKTKINVADFLEGSGITPSGYWPAILNDSIKVFCKTSSLGVVSFLANTQHKHVLTEFGFEKLTSKHYIMKVKAGKDYKVRVYGALVFDLQQKLSLPFSSIQPFLEG